jgi:hypothetical protein
MYLTGILQYLIWPCFIVLNWFIIKYAIEAYEKKFPKKDETEEIAG